VRIREASADDIRAVVMAMRAVDAEEQLAVGFDPSREELAERLVLAGEMAIKQFALLTDDGEPAGLVSAFLTAPRVAAVHQVATDRWPEIGAAAFRFYRRRFIPRVLAPNVALAEAKLLDTHILARRWLGRLGFTENGGPLPYGRRGERFVHCVWLNPSPLARTGQAPSALPPTEA
jgi:hypothetical protein